MRAREAMTSRAQGVVTCAASTDPAQAMAAPKRANTSSRAPVNRPRVAIHCRLLFAFCTRGAIAKIIGVH